VEVYLDRYFNPTISLIIIPKPERFEEDGQPDDQLVAREHIERAQQQRNETDPVGLVAELVSLDASLSWMLYPLII
jgi:hypothetical protein